ncbi:MAG: hypothetical protein JNK75_01620 [Betaproteobacteria bacterium]|nr:hypothetical protein [Betaproteobacteria bacterium]
MPSGPVHSSPIHAGAGTLRPWRLLLLSSALLLQACVTAPDERIALPDLPPLTPACVQFEAPQAASAAQGAAQPLERVTVRAPTDPADALIERAWQKSLEGDRATVMRLYARALNRTDATWRTERIHWSYGWSMFNLGDPGCALAHFGRARDLDAAAAESWLPQTLAVTYWQMGAHDTAQHWFDSAARANPGCWSDARKAEGCTRHWQPKERKALGELLHARRAWKFR